MKRKSTSLLVSIFILLSYSFPLHAISRTTAHCITAATLLATTGGSYKLWSNNKNIHPLYFGASSTVLTCLVYYYVQRITPQGRLKRAHRLLDQLARHKLARIKFDNEETFFDTVHDVYLTDDLPLISAYSHLLNLLPSAHYAFGLINKASAEVGNDSVLEEECDSTFTRANKLFNNITSAIKRIRNHKDYLSQLQIYKEFLTNEKQTLAQEQMATAQLQMAGAQQSSTFLQWLKAIFGFFRS